MQHTVEKFLCTYSHFESLFLCIFKIILDQENKISSVKNPNYIYQYIWCCIKL